MGPRRDWRGYEDETGPDRPGSVALQWGHAVIGVDTLKSLRGIFEAALLQWGHAVIGVDTRRRPIALTTPLSFNGATP